MRFLGFGSGFGDYGLGFCDYGLGLRAKGLGFRFKGVGLTGLLSKNLTQVIFSPHGGELN